MTRRWLSFPSADGSHYPLDIYIQEKELVLEPFLFNSKYSLTLQALVSHFEWVSPTYLIAGVHTLKMVKTTSRSLPRQTLHALLYALYVLYILFLFSYAGATLFPGISSAQSPLEAIISRFLLLLLPVALLTLVGRFLQAGIRSTKNRLEAGHHADCCVLVELSQGGNLRGYYRHRM